MEMSEMKIDDAIEYLPKASQTIPTQDEKFLFFFDPKIMDEKKFLFGLSLKNGVQIFSAVILIQAISSFFDIFSPGSFLNFFAKIIAFAIYFVAGFYALLSTLKNNYSYAKCAYIVISIVFLFNALYYVCKSLIKIIEFITPWDGDFLQLDFLVFVFGYGVFLFIYLYLIYVLYHFMLEIKGQNVVQNIEDEANEANIMKSE